MKLSALISGIKTDTIYEDIEIKNITADSRKVKQGDLFVCIKGANFDGHDKAQSALQDGAAAIITERELPIVGCQIIVESTRAAYSEICANYFGRPAQELKLIGVTGTNGKTTTSLLIKGMLDKLGIKSGLIGTVKNMVGDKEYPAELTTPEYFELQSLFAEMANAGCEYCVMEVSSQALAQKRVEGCCFELAVFTNLTQDHLDYHGTIENYAAAKAELFKKAKKAIFNIDDPSWELMAEAASCSRVTYSARYDSADYVAKNIRLFNDHITYEMIGANTIGRAVLKIPGDFTVYNSMAAAVSIMELGYDFDKVLSLLPSLEGVKGRIEVVPTDTDYTVIIDYAHSPDGLRNILTSLRKFARARILTVFGCGGDRDAAKRPIMGGIAAELSDITFVTSDNPRTEDPNAIIAQILKGISRRKYEVRVEADRTKAIALALSEAKAEDIVLLAGKGHEDYQIIGKEKIHYDEREIVAQLLS